MKGQNPHTHILTAEDGQGTHRHIKNIGMKLY